MDEKERMALQTLFDQLADLLCRHQERCDELLIESDILTEDIIEELCSFDEPIAGCFAQLRRLTTAV
jgi:hypothetical protein